MDPYFTVTVSYIDEVPSEASGLTDWKLARGTIAFRRIEGSHTGETFATMLQEIFDEYGILHKASYNRKSITSINIRFRWDIVHRTTTLQMTKRSEF
jgi:hypothetical protein